MRSVYIETSIISYLAARPSKNLVAAAWQQVTSDWWAGERKRYELSLPKPEPEREAWQRSD